MEEMKIEWLTGHTKQQRDKRDKEREKKKDTVSFTIIEFLCENRSTNNTKQIQANT